MAKKKAELLTNKCTVRIRGIPCVIEGDTLEEMLDEFTEVRNICFRCNYDISEIQRRIESLTAAASTAKALSKVGLPGLRPVLEVGAAEAERAGGETNTSTIEQITEQVLGTRSGERI